MIGGLIAALRGKRFCQGREARKVTLEQNRFGALSLRQPPNSDHRAKQTRTHTRGRVRRSAPPRESFKRSHEAGKRARKRRAAKSRETASAKRQAQKRPAKQSEKHHARAETASGERGAQTRSEARTPNTKRTQTRRTAADFVPCPAQDWRKKVLFSLSPRLSFLKMKRRANKERAHASTPRAETQTRPARGKGEGGAGGEENTAAEHKTLKVFRCARETTGAGHSAQGARSARPIGKAANRVSGKRIKTALA